MSYTNFITNHLCIHMSTSTGVPQQPSPQGMSNIKLTPQQLLNLQQQQQMHNQRNPSQPASQQIRKPSDLYLNQQTQQMNKATIQGKKKKKQIVKNRYSNISNKLLIYLIYLRIVNKIVYQKYLVLFFREFFLVPYKKIVKKEEEFTNH